MAESIDLPLSTASRKERYELLLPQLHHLVEDESDLIANLGNLMAALKEAMGFLWIGVYFVRAEELVLGPFQGPLACTRIAYGKGVCGIAWKEGRTIVVPDVDQFPGHIACSSLSKSEIVLPVFSNDKVVMVLDVDSDRLADFDETDAVALGKVTGIISELLAKAPAR
ncbi:MAG: GAF domain-containing protein [Bacteroidetes bacterium]|nr:GAF domain-containing protein [Bacteroidota bacterium]